MGYKDYETHLCHFIEQMKSSKIYTYACYKIGICCHTTHKDDRVASILGDSNEY